MIIEFVHGGTHILKRPVEFGAHPPPVTDIRLVRDALASGDDRLPDVNCVRKRQDLSAEFLNPFSILGFHCHESLGDHIAKEQGRSGAVIGCGGLAVAQLPLPVRVPEFVEHSENLTRDGNHHVVDSRCGEVGNGDFLRGIVGTEACREKYAGDQKG